MMIDLKDVIQLWISNNKNLSRSWTLFKDPDDTWILKPKIPKFYKVNSRGLVLSDYMKLHYDDDGQFEEKGCHSTLILAHDREFFKKLARWMRLVRR